ncbi:MAG: DUF3422 family protein [Pseudomonadota bacterium]
MANIETPRLDTQRWFTNRRPTYKIDSPCLLRQFVLRPLEFNDVVVLAESELRKIAERQLINTLNEFIADIDPEVSFDPEIAWDAYRKRIEAIEKDSTPPEDTNPPPIGYESENRYKSHYRAFKSKGIDFELIIDIHTEYVAIEVRAYPLRNELQAALDAQDAEKAKVLTTVYDELEQLDSEIDEGTKSDLSEETSDRLFRDFWEHLTDFGAIEIEKLFRRHGDTNQLEEIAITRRHKPNDDDKPRKAPRHQIDIDVASTQFAKLQIKSIFNGFILSRKRKNPTRLDASGTQEKPARMMYGDEIKEKLYRGPSDKNLTQRSADFHDEVLTGNVEYVYHHSRFFMPTLGFNMKNVRENDIHSASSVWCGVLDGLGVYGCSFSRETTLDVAEKDPKNSKFFEMKPKPSWSEVRFFVIYAGPSLNQLARLVQRFLYCGQNRVFMSPDFIQFQITAQKMRALGARVDQETLGEFDEEDLRKIRTKIEEYNQQVRGGIEYRVKRADFYSQNLKRRIANLRTVRILGWQTYDEYVARTYGPHVAGYKEADELRNELELKIARAEDQLETQATIRLMMIAAIGVVASFAFRLFGYDFTFENIDKRATLEAFAIIFVIGGFIWYLRKTWKGSGS